MSRIYLFLASLVVASCSFAQSSVTEQHWGQLLHRWRWMQYWQNTTDLGSKYRAGRQVRILFFWRGDDLVDSMGFCSGTLEVCQFYPSVSTILNHFEMAVLPGGDLRAAFKKFAEEAFEQYQSPLYQGQPRPPGPREGEYKTELISITLPMLDPPEVILKHQVRPRSELDALVRQLGCISTTQCKFHLLIPFYSDHDLWVPVYRECPEDCGASRSPVILFPKLTEGRWWLGATNLDADPDYVSRTRQRIEKALMLEVGR